MNAAGLFERVWKIGLRSLGFLGLLVAAVIVGPFPLFFYASRTISRFFDHEKVGAWKRKHMVFGHLVSDKPFFKRPLWAHNTPEVAMLPPLSPYKANAPVKITEPVRGAEGLQAENAPTQRREATPLHEEREEEEIGGAEMEMPSAAELLGEEEAEAPITVQPKELRRTSAHTQIGMLKQSPIPQLKMCKISYQNEEPVYLCAVPAGGRYPNVGELSRVLAKQAQQGQVVKGNLVITQWDKAFVYQLDGGVHNHSILEAGAGGDLYQILSQHLNLPAKTLKSVVAKETGVAPIKTRAHDTSAFVEIQ